jgi:hypothetical protein
LVNKMPWPKTPLRAKVERGAAMVEFAIVIVVFMLLVMGGFEFGRMIFEWGRTVEATRIGVRTAVVSTPPTGCLNGSRLNLSCPGGTPVICTPDDLSPVLEVMQRIQPKIEAANVELTYACSGAGFELRPTPVPVITVEVQNLTFEPVVAGLLGLPTQIPIPGFASSQTGESMRDLN